MNADDIKRIARRYYEEVFEQRNLAVLDELVDPDFVGYSASFGEYTREDMHRDISRDHTNMPEDEVIADDQIADGERVMTR